MNKYELETFLESRASCKFKNGKARCFSHNDKTPSLSVYEKNGKARYKCHACGIHGDEIDYLMNYENKTKIEALNTLGYELNNNQKEILTTKQKIQKSFKEYAANKRLTLNKIWYFTDTKDSILYAKAKFIDYEGKKTFRQCRIDNDKAIFNLSDTTQVPYNYYNLNKALNEKKSIYIVEGEKDADTLINLGLIATSFKGVTDFKWSTFQDVNVYIIPDKDPAGDKYKESLFENMKQYVKSFNVIVPDMYDTLPTGSDITDCFDNGYTLNQFKNNVRYSWDYKKSQKYKYVSITKEGRVIPKKSWENLECLLSHEDIKLKYNEITKRIESKSFKKDELLIDIYSKCQLNGFNLTISDTRLFLLRAATKYRYNPFLDMIKENINGDYSIIDKVFNCLKIQPEFEYNTILYNKLFKKWVLNVVRQATNTLEKNYGSQGVLVLQGSQGIGKTSFFKCLIDSKFFGESRDLKPDNKDNVRENTNKIIVELGELDSTLKGDQARIKAFISSGIDEYRIPYDIDSKEYPRLTTFCATVNRIDFLKDETGSRRFWVIPIESVNIEELKKIDTNKLWGAAYSLLLSKTYPYYLNQEELEELQKSNSSDFVVENSYSIMINEIFDFAQKEEYWKVYKISDLVEILGISKCESKSLKNELLRRGHRQGAHRTRYNGNPDKTEYGFKLPNVNKQEYENMIKNHFEIIQGGKK